MPSAMGFFSGFMPVKANASMMPSFTIMVNDTKPIWYYCSQGNHCQKGMLWFKQLRLLWLLWFLWLTELKPIRTQ
ncbi:MAG: hypothetical protein LQ350_003425 [Teloschistes chrysophthalmus]|nr:MAG: hypothetical protein LQ350_003425 [Niorma chrysophthalma]